MRTEREKAVIRDGFGGKEEWERGGGKDAIASARATPGEFVAPAREQRIPRQRKKVWQNRECVDQRSDGVIG